MRIATWNVNSIRSRLDRVLAWLGAAQPDVACFQETKATDEAFPWAPLQAAGYHAVAHGQKTYNGVAILSRAEPQNVRRGLTGWDDAAARAIWADVGTVTVASLYVPNGQTVGSDKYTYKLRWMRQLLAELRGRFTPSSPLVLCGDFNVARDAADVARPDAWEGSVLFDEGSRRALEDVLGWGLVDVLRRHHPEGGLYTWWDYRRTAFPKNDGLRLDYVLATEPLARRCTDAAVDREQRKGEQPSDHAPVMAAFDV